MSAGRLSISAISPWVAAFLDALRRRLLTERQFSFIMFHHVTGLPFESTMTTSGAYDDLTLWEQIDSGAQYTPAKKWLTSVPIGL